MEASASVRRSHFKSLMGVEQSSSRHFGCLESYLLSAALADLAFIDEV
jgi:hypothetical protein